MGKKNNNSIEFDLEDFIINDVNITYPNFAHDGMVEKTIFTERYFAALMKIHYLNRIKFDGTSWWIYDIELQYWSEEQFINSRIWDCICDHFRRKEYIYEEVFNTHFDKIYTEEVLNDMAESKQEKLKKLHPFIIFNKLQVSLHSSQKECMHTDTYLAQIVFDKHFLAKCDPIGYINVFKMEIKKEWHQLEDFKGEEYYKEKPEKIPVMINLAFPNEIFPRSPSYLMTDELDIVIGETSEYDKNELAYIITNICNGNYSRMKQILLGYALALKGTDKAYTFCHTGNGSNGKSILKALLQTAFKPFVLNVASSELIRKAKGSRDKFHSSLRGKRILLVEELDELEVDTEELKILSGNGEITYKGLWKQKTIDIPYTGRLFIYKNNELNIGNKGTDGGLARRIKIVEHSNKFVSAEKKEKLYPNNNNMLEGDPELESRVLQGEYNTVFFELILDLLKDNHTEDWDAEFGKATEELLEDSQCEIIDWCELGLVIGTGVVGSIVTLHELFDAMVVDFPNIKIKTIKTKVKQYFKQRFPNIEIEECRYYHNNKRVRGLKINNVLLGGDNTTSNQIDELDTN